jgi:4-aminobutyrate aminotransferase
MGLMMAMDIVSDPDSQTPDQAQRDEIVQTAFQQGLLLLGCGESAVRFCPPLCITSEQIDRGLEILSRILSKSEKLAV